MSISRKFILSLIFVTLINKIDSLETENILLVQLVNAIENEPRHLEYLLKQNINPDLIETLLDFSRKQLYSAQKQKNSNDIKKYTEIIQKLEMEPQKIKVRQELWQYFPPEVSGIIEQYRGDEIGGIEEQIQNFLRTYTAHVINPQEVFDKLKRFDTYKKIKFLQFLEADIKLTDAHTVITKEKDKNTKNKAGMIIREYEPTIQKVTSDVLDPNYWRITNTPLDLDPKFQYLIYKFLYSILDERTKKEHQITSPENIKNSFLSNRFKNDFKDL